MTTNNPERASVKVLRECIELQNQKANDYQNGVSSVKQADYYRLGVDSIYDMMHTKMLRLKSLMETAKSNSNSTPKFESLKDTAKDLINYASFFAAWLENGIDGQNPDNDMFNRPSTSKGETTKVIIDEPIVLNEKDKSFLKTLENTGIIKTSDSYYRSGIPDRVTSDYDTDRSR